MPIATSVLVNSSVDQPQRLPAAKMRAHQRLHDRQQNQRRGQRPQEPQHELRRRLERRRLVAKRNADERAPAPRRRGCADKGASRATSRGRPGGRSFVPHLVRSTGTTLVLAKDSN